MIHLIFLRVGCGQAPSSKLFPVAALPVSLPVAVRREGLEGTVPTILQKKNMQKTQIVGILDHATVTQFHVQNPCELYITAGSSHLCDWSFVLSGNFTADSL